MYSIEKGGRQWPVGNGHPRGFGDQTSLTQSASRMADSCIGGRRHGGSGLNAVLQKHPGWFHSRDALITWNTPHFPLKKRHAACNPITTQFVISPAFKHFMLAAWNTPTLDSQVVYCIDQPNLAPQITKPNTNAIQMQMNGFQRFMIKMLFQEVPSKNQSYMPSKGGRGVHLPSSLEYRNVSLYFPAFSLE